MRRNLATWSASKLYAIRNDIQYPPYQREPSVWNKEKQRLLIDSMLVGIDIPKIYLYKHPDSEVYDCVDGQQRIQAITTFFDNKLKTLEGEYFKDLSSDKEKTIQEYEFTIAIISEASDKELRLLFERLQLGAPLNTGERLRVLTGEMREFIFKYGKEHPFFRNVNITERRYAKETTFAQICINSFNLSLEGNFYPARYVNLKPFIEHYKSLKGYEKETDRILCTLNTLDNEFGSSASNLRNRASVVSAYLFIEHLIVSDRESEIQAFVEFYLMFLEILMNEAQKGLDYDPKYRDLLDFQTYVIQASISKNAIRRRHEMLERYFTHYQKTGKIFTTQ